MRLLQLEVRGRHALRRSLRAGHRRRSTARAASGRRDWFFFVNGLEAEVGAAEYELSPGDRVQWDYRHWDDGDARARDRGRVPGAVPATGSRASGARCGSSARTAQTRPVPRREGRAASARACRCPGRRSGRPAPRHVTRLVVARWPRGADRARRADARGGSGGERRVRALRPATAASLELLDERRRGGADRAARGRHGARGRAAPAR